MGPVATQVTAGTDDRSQTLGLPRAKTWTFPGESIFDRAASALAIIGLVSDGRLEEESRKKDSIIWDGNSV